MEMPTWWNERRYGLFVQSSLATVPAWSPIGEDADCYRSHLGEGAREGMPPPTPMVEVLAHHRDRWGHIEHYDDFQPLLMFDRFDAEAWVRLVVDAGAGYAVFTARHHDGWSWWDAPDTTRSLLTAGPHSNVLAECAAACERNDVVFGSAYSLTDGSDESAGTDRRIDTVRAQLTDLVDRLGSHVLWNDDSRITDATGNPEVEPGHIDDVLATVRSIDPQVLVDDRWPRGEHARGDPTPVQTFDHAPPDSVVATPWELRRSLGAGLGHNTAARPEHHLSGVEIVALLTEVVAKGGHLLLALAPAADGTIPELQRQPLLEAGTWIRDHRALIDRSEPWLHWGDDHVRYLRVDDDVHVVEIGGRGHFAALDPAAQRVESVDVDGVRIPFHQDADGLHLDIPRAPLDRRDRADRVTDIRVYRLRLADVERPTELFATEPRRPIDLAPLLRDVSPGDIVQLGDGVYLGPVVVPAGVIVRGLGGDRTSITGPRTAITMEANSRLEHVAVTPAADGHGHTADVVLTGPGSTVLGCRIAGRVVVHGDHVRIRATTAGGIMADGADRLTVTRCEFRGTRRDVGVELVGGSGHEVDSCEFSDHLVAISAVGTTGTIVRGNNIHARRCGVHLDGTDGAHVHGNFIARTTRGVDVDGGTQAVIDGNAVCDGDSGCIVAWGASDCQVSGNRWERCRIGVLAWAAIGLHAHNNTAIDLHEPDAAHTTGP